MAWEKNKKPSGDGDAPATSFVRLPSKVERPPQRPVEGGAQPGAWTPSGPPQSQPQGQPWSSGAPFGGFQAGSNTGLTRRESSRGRALAVLGVLVAMLILGGAAIWLAFRVDGSGTPEAQQTVTPPPVDPNAGKARVDYVDDDEDPEDPEPPPVKPTTATSGSGKTSTGKTSTGKTSTGKSTTGKGTSTTGRTPGNPRGTTTGK